MMTPGLAKAQYGTRLGARHGTAARWRARRTGVCRLAAAVAAVALGVMVSVYVPAAARAALLPRVPVMPDRFAPAQLGITLPCAPWRMAGFCAA